MREYYDALGDDEWSRLVDSPRGRVSFEVHRRLLRTYVKPGDRVLEIGAGPGRFTIELAARGALIDVTDFSPVQLELNRAHVQGTDAESSVQSRELLDICDTDRYADGAYDVVLAYGGPLSYAFEETDRAMTGLLRVTKPGGVVLASVMSLLGSWRLFLGAALEDIKRVGEDANDVVLTTGDLRPMGTRHVCQLFRSRDVAELVRRCGGTVMAMSASNWASLADPAILEEIERSPDSWQRFLEHELRACAEPGALDGGTHLVFVAGHQS